MREPIRSKDVMYSKLVAGEFGNTCPVYFSVDQWACRPSPCHKPLWGIRSHTSGDPRAKLDVPTVEVIDYCRRTFGEHGFNITPMVDHMLTFRGEVYDGPRGIVLFGVAGRRELKWRPALRGYGREFTGSAARAILRAVLNGNSHDDLQILLEQYPGHVVEFTALDRNFGIVPGRNAVVWECRDGESGEYELSTWRNYL